MLPNWKVTYSGLGRLRFMRPIFKSFNINHSYQSIYAVGSYNTFSSFMKLTGSRGFVNDVSTGNPVPSSMFDISTVSITENFSPLIGFDMTFRNNLTAKVEYNRSRMLALSMTSQQISEARSNDYVIGIGYKIDDLKIFRPNSRPKRRNARKSSTTKKNAENNAEDEDESSSSSSSRNPEQSATTLTCAWTSPYATKAPFSVTYLQRFRRLLRATARSAYPSRPTIHCRN